MSTRVEISRVFSVTAAASGITTCSIHNNTHAFVGHFLRYDHHVWLFHFLKDTHITIVPPLLSVFLNAIRYVLPIIGISGYRFNPPKCLRILLRSR